MARWKLEISHYQQYADDMVTPGIYAPQVGGGFFLDTNGGVGILDPLSDASGFWLTVDPSEITGLETMNLTYRLKNDLEMRNPDGSNYVFGLVDSIDIFAGAGTLSTAYQFIKAWLIDDATAPNNSIACQLTNLDCKDEFGEPYIILTNLNIGVNQIKWNNVHCIISCDLKEIQPRVSCFERTLIDDNHQGWFWEDTTFDHPRFKYCNKISPYLILLLMSIINSVLWPLLLVETIINTVINALNGLGFNIGAWTPFSDLIGSFLNMILGCNFEHPAPLLRTYIQNVCDKCLLTYNSTEDLFNSTVLSYPLNDGSDPNFGADDPYFNTVMFYPHANRKGMKTGKNDKRWQQQYTPGFTGFSLTEELRIVFNAEWRIYNNIFAFVKKGQGDWINAYALVFDFTGPDNALLVNQYFEFEWDEVQRSAYMRGVYTTSDAFDTNQANVNERWNSIVDFNLNKNPNFKGEKDNTSQYFAATQFRFDNTERDYVIDGVLGTFGNIYTNLPLAMQQQVDAIIADVPTHAILLESMQVEKPRLIIWDPALSGNNDFVNSNSYSQNFAIINFGIDFTPNKTGYVPLPDAGGYVNPVPDPYYNQLVQIGPFSYLQSYSYVHNPQYDVNYWDTYYVYSLPLHFDEMFKYTLYGNLYKEDDAQFVPPMRVKTKATVKACCEVFDALGINGSGLIKLNCKVRVPYDTAGNYYDMWIYDIKYSAETNTVELSLHTNKYN